MKKFRYILITLLCGLISVIESCQKLDQFLEKPVMDDTIIDDIFASRTLATRALTSCYVALPFGLPVMGGSHDGGNNKPLTGVGQGMIDHLSDLLHNLHGTTNGPLHFYYPGNYNSSIEQNSPGYVKYSFIREGQWTAIRRCWTILENIDKVPDMDESEKRQFKAEARTIIAIHYTEMLRHLGGVPKVDHRYSPNEDLSTPRMTIRDMIEWIDDLIEDAYQDLPYEYSDPNMYGRLTRPGALAVRVRAYHFAASPLFNDNEPYLAGPAADAHYCWLGEKDNELWKRTRDLADALIVDAENHGYGLVQPTTPDVAGYRAAYRKAYHEGKNGETLIITRSREQNYVAPKAGYFTNFYNDGGYQASQNWVDMFPMANGFDIKPDQPNHASGWDEQKPTDNRDPRLYESVAVNNDKWGTGGNTARFWQGGAEGATNRLAQFGTTSRKFNLGGTGAQMECIGKPIVWPYIRLADIYLIYAEAANQYEGSPSVQAYERVNAVRARVGLPGLPVWTDENKFHKFHAAVMKERVCELGQENSRWFDMVRWKMKDVFTVTMRAQRSWLWERNAAYNIAGKIQGTRTNSYDGDYLIGDGVIGANGVLYEKLSGTAANKNFNAANHVITYQYFDFPEENTRSWAINFSPKWYLSAFPMGEVNKGYGLMQNPGW